MDGIVLGLFLFAAFLGGFASGLAGFAMGFVVSGIWLHMITPIQTTALIVGYGLWTQGYGVWKLRHSLSWRNVAPFIIGGTIGVPIGTLLLTYIDPAYMRSGVGVLLVVYGIYGLAQPAFKPVHGRRRGRWRRRISERHAVRADRPAGIHHHRLVPVARLDQGRAARGIPAGDAGGHRRDRDFAELHRRRHRGDQSSCMCSAFPRCWPACGSASGCTESSTTSRSAR